MSSEINGTIAMARCLAHVVLYHPGRPDLSMSVSGLIDPGAMQSAVSPRLAEMLYLPKNGEAEISAAAGWQKAPTYAADLEFWEAMQEGQQAVFRNMTLVTMVGSVGAPQLLIGMDLLGRAELQILGPQGTWRMKFPDRTESEQP